jgi:hypothetical protein
MIVLEDGKSGLPGVSFETPSSSSEADLSPAQEFAPGNSWAATGIVTITPHDAVRGNALFGADVLHRLAGKDRLGGGGGGDTLPGATGIDTPGGGLRNDRLATA